MNRNKLYIFLFTACMAGYIWLAISYINGYNLKDNELGVCIFKHVTNIPCPSCGSTRSILSLLHGNVVGSFFWNPIGLILISIMVISPIWIIFDVIKKKSTLFNFFNTTENFLKRTWVGIPAVLLVIGNWVWNIYKGL